MIRRTFTLGLVLALAVPAVRAQAQTFATSDPVLQQIWHEGMENSRTYPLAQALLDSIGPRLTGSPQYAAGADWLRAMYQSWGIEARNEQYGTWRGWRRGISHVDLVAPRVRSLEAMLLAWSPGSGGKKRGEVIVLPEVAHGLNDSVVKNECSEARVQFVYGLDDANRIGLRHMFELNGNVTDVDKPFAVKPIGLAFAGKCECPGCRTFHGISQLVDFFFRKDRPSNQVTVGAVVALLGACQVKRHLQ